MRTPIKIGTRDSQLARWQANRVKQELEALGYACELVPIKSQGDLDLETPLYELGITGIFTKTLDIALLNGQIDVAVHSFKDVPTLLPKGLVQTAVLPRANSMDVLIPRSTFDPTNNCTIATGSLRRRAQWLNRYPHHDLTGLRGNVHTRLEKLKTSQWDGAIFAAAGLERVGLLPENAIRLDWMVPAPAQGAMAVVCREDDKECRDASARLNHTNSALCTRIERAFLRTLEGGCSAPIGALAVLEGGHLTFKGVLLSLDGKRRINVEQEVPINESDGLGESLARQVLERGGSELMDQIRRSN